MTSIDSTAFEYDHNGNTTKDDIHTNTWDYRNELVTSNDGTNYLSYTYDQNSDRTSVFDGTNTDYYPNKYFSERTGVANKDIYLDNTLVGTVKGTGVGTKYYYNHTDQISGSNVTTDCDFKFAIIKP